MKIAVITVVWNGRDDARRLLEALARMPHALDIAVVDNASHDGTAAMVRADFPAVTLLEQRENLGGAGGFAVGMAWALTRGCDAVWLMDGDAWPRADALEPLVATLERRAEVGAVGSLIAMADRPETTQEIGGRFAPRSGRPCFLHAFAPVAAPRTAEDVDWVPACSLLARADAIRRVGAFDPAFFVFGDDLDWCWRLRNAGWRIATAPDSVVFHRYPGGKALTPWRAYYSTRNMPELFRRHLRGFDGLFHRWLWLGHGFLHARRWQRWGQVAEATAARQALADAVAGRLGRRDGLPPATPPGPDPLPDPGSGSVVLAGGGELWADLALARAWQAAYPQRPLTVLATPALVALLADEPQVVLKSVSHDRHLVRGATVLVSGRLPRWVRGATAVWRWRQGHGQRLTPRWEGLVDTGDHMLAALEALRCCMRLFTA